MSGWIVQLEKKRHHSASEVEGDRILGECGDIVSFSLLFLVRLGGPPLDSVSTGIPIEFRGHIQSSGSVAILGAVLDRQPQLNTGRPIQVC